MPSVTDYLKVGGQQSNVPGWNDQAPSVAPAGSGADTVLQIYVPAEHTVLDYGAGAIPGIRMATDHHAHLTAGTPCTTISLGKAAGPSVSGSDGLNIFTAGAKTEEVMEYTFEHYHEAKQERVDGDWDEHCDKAKREETVGALTRKVGGDVSDNYGQNHKSKVGGFYTKDVVGDYFVHVGGDCDIKYKGRANVTYGGEQSDTFMSPKYDFHWGIKSSTFLGLDFSANAGEKVSIYAGDSHTVNMGLSMNVTAAVDRNFNFGGNITLNESYVASTTLLSRSKTLIDLSKKDASMPEDKLVLSKAQVHILTATFKCIK